MKTLTTTLAAAAVAMAPLQVVEATALASASFEVTNFTWWQDMTNDGPSGDDVPITLDFSGPSSNLASGSFNDIAVIGTQLDGTSAGNNGIRTGVLNGGSPLDLPQVCQGAGCVPFAENDFSAHPVVFASQYAHADQLLAQSWMDLLNAPTGTGDTVDQSGGATLGYRTDVSLPWAATGSATAVLTSPAQVTPLAGFGETVDTYFTLDFTAQALAMLDAGEEPGSFASSLLSLNILLNDTSWNAFTLGANLNFDPDYPEVPPSISMASGSISSFGVPLILNGGFPNTLLVSATLNANAQAQEPDGPPGVPAPATLLLMAVGLAGMGMRRHRR